MTLRLSLHWEVRLRNLLRNPGPQNCRGSLEAGDIFSDISASPLDMRFLGVNGSIHEGGCHLQGS